MDDIDRQTESLGTPAVWESADEDIAWNSGFSFRYEEWENEFMTFGEGVMLLIAIGVFLYLIYALIWPERF